MARIPIRVKVYKKSPLATVVNMIGTLMLLLGVGSVMGLLSGSYEIGWFAIFLPIGIICKIYAPKINEKKVFELWFKELKEKGIEQQLSSSLEVALAVFNANPHKRTLEYITMHNYQAGELIRKKLCQQNINDDKFNQK